METFLTLVAQIYKYGFLFIVGITTLMMIIGSDPAALTFGKGMSAIGYPFMWIYDNMAYPLFELSNAPYSMVNNMTYETKEAIGGVAYLFILVGTGFLFMGSVVTIIAYFIFMFLVFPIWTVFDKGYAAVWAIYVNPFHIFVAVTIPFMAEMKNATDMQSDNPVIRQMAVNDDLADRITGKMITKQGFVDFVTDRKRQAAGNLKSNIRDIKWF